MKTGDHLQGQNNIHVLIVIECSQWKTKIPYIFLRISLCLSLSLFFFFAIEKNYFHTKKKKNQSWKYLSFATISLKHKKTNKKRPTKDKCAHESIGGD